MANIPSPVKMCFICGQDVAALKRFKDAQGNYYCAPCNANRQQAPAAIAVASPIAPPATPARLTSPYEFDSAQESDPAAAPTTLAPGTMTNYVLCPCCGKYRPPGSKICVACGIKLKSGRPLLTAEGVDVDTLENQARGILRWISLFIWLGLYPIASEAYGACMPIVVWAITVLTIIASVAFWAADYDNKAGGDEAPNKFMLWCGPPLSDDVEAIKFTVHDKETGRDEVETVPASHFGRFHWYQLITNAFLHANLMHIAGNLLFLIVLGPRVNALLGQVKTMILYPLLAVASGGAQLLFTHYDLPTPSLGASGAIMGLVGMYLVLFPVHKVYMAFWLRISWRWDAWIKIWALRGFWVPLFYIAFDVAATAMSSHDHVAHWAHLGGFITGVVVASVLLISRQVDAHGGDLFSVILGKYAWPLIGKPNQYAQRNLAKVRRMSARVT